MTGETILLKSFHSAVISEPKAPRGSVIKQIQRENG